MGGAGSAIAANHVYRLAAPDGLTLLSILRPAPNSATISVSSLVISQARGDVVGSNGRGMPGNAMNASAPATISSADAAGSRPEKNLGSQYATMTDAPTLVRKTW